MLWIIALALICTVVVMSGKRKGRPRLADVELNLAFLPPPAPALRKPALPASRMTQLERMEVLGTDNVLKNMMAVIAPQGRLTYPYGLTELGPDDPDSSDVGRVFIVPDAWIDTNMSTAVSDTIFHHVYEVGGNLEY